MPFGGLLTVGLITAGTSLAGGLMGSSAAKGASEAQVKAAAEARQYIQDLLDKYNPPIGEAAQKAADLSLGAGVGAQDEIRRALAAGRTDVLGGVGQANELLAPYVGLGTDAAANLKTLMAPGGGLDKTFTAADMQAFDPGYAFRMEQASKALQGSAAARGAALGGGTLGALTGLNQNLASSEFGAAQERFRQQQADRFNRLNTLLGTGFQAAGQTGANITGANRFLAGQDLTGAQNIGQFMIQPAQFAGTALAGGAEAQANMAMQAGRSISDLISGAGNAQAAGMIGGANAWSSALGGVANAAGGLGKYYTDQQTLAKLADLLKNPAVTGPTEKV
jgi:hypothetical protein